MESVNRTTGQIVSDCMSGDDQVRSELEKMIGKPFESATPTERKIALDCLAAIDGKRPKTV